MFAKSKIYFSDLRTRPMPALLAIALLGWIVLLIFGDATMHQHTSVHHHHETMNPAVSDIVLQSAWSWFLMLVAMMTPLLAQSIEYIWVRSLPRRRVRGIILFVVAYTMMWMLAGGVLMSIAQLLQAIPAINGIGIIPPAIALAVLFIWQASPWKQFSFNRCHLVSRLSAFGWAADVDCLRFGFIKGFWCIGSCWAWMLFPLVFTPMVPMMLLASLFLFFEQYKPGRRPQWHLPFAVGR